VGDVVEETLLWRWEGGGGGGVGRLSSWETLEHAVWRRISVGWTRAQTQTATAHARTQVLA
jgi:hypothetical protein